MTSKAIPEGLERIIAHLVVKGAAEAIDFYKQAFGAEEIMRLPGPDGKSLWHAEVRIGQSVVFLADEVPQGIGIAAPATLNGTTVTLTMYVENADRTFNQAVAAGAKAAMPLQDMFWGDRYGIVQDPFGHMWAIVSHVEDVSPKAMSERALDTAKRMKG